jgi:hypothetical protein
MSTYPFCVIPTPLGTFTANNEVASNLASHLGEFDSIGMTWKPGVSSTFLQGDFGSAKPIDFVSMIAATASPTSTYRFALGTSAANASSASPAYDSGAQTFISPAITRADGLYNSHLEIGTVQTYRYWYLELFNLGTFEASTFVMGQKVTPATWYNPGFEFGIEDLGDIDFSRYGIPEETPGRTFRKLGFTLGWLSEIDFETKFRPLVETLGKRRVAFWCFDPTANAYRQARSYLGWLRPPPAARHIANTPDGPRFSKEFEVLSMI